MNNRNFHFLSMLIMLLVGTATGLAQSLPIALSLKSGETVEYSYSDNPTITYDDYTVTIKTETSTNVYQMSDIAKISFTDADNEEGSDPDKPIINVEDEQVNPSELTLVSPVTPDEVLYEEGATSWALSQGGIDEGQIDSLKVGPYMLVKFDMSEIWDYNFTKAELKFDAKYTGTDKKTTGMCVSVMDDTSWDATTATFNNVNKNASEPFNPVIYTDRGALTHISYDVLDCVRADKNKVIAFAIYTSTEREHEVSNIRLVLSYTNEEIEKIEYTFNAVDGNGDFIKELESGECLKTDNKKYYAPLAVEKDGKWYVGSTDYEHAVEESGIINIQYNLRDDMVSFVDFNNGEKSPYYSGGAYGYALGSSSFVGGTSLGDITPGKYVAVVAFVSDGNRQVIIRDASNDSSENVIATLPISKYSYSGTYESEEFTITQTTPLTVTGYINETGKINQSATMDFIYLLKTGEVETPDEYTDIASLDNTVYIEKSEAYVGSQVELSVKMKNTVDDIASYQFNLYLPEGITIATDPDDPDFLLAELSTERTTTRRHNTFEVAKQNDGSVLVLCASTNNYTFSGNDGEVCRITINVSQELEAGEYPIQLKKIVMADTQATSKTYKTECVTSVITIKKYKQGDTNGDGEINVGDYNTLVNYIKGNAGAGIEDSMDVNGDEEVNVGDLNTLVNIIKNN